MFQIKIREKPRFECSKKVYFSGTSHSLVLSHKDKKQRVNLQKMMKQIFVVAVNNLPCGPSLKYSGAMEEEEDGGLVFCLCHAEGADF